ncbi:unnamed protein product [Diatraea saccharalis]|uniref:Uncharacterized protein n=1 Tax=Diatraea saccharalis TaxID=40085 RepID=A0A9P0CA31_9NEOP|nr:unnamed protein product [Diatraea saccharalis]
MQPTARVAAWSAWAGWAAVPRDLLEHRRVRISLHELPPRRDSPLTIYTPEQIRHIIRLETALGRWPPTAPPAIWRPDARPYDLDAHWRLPDMIQNVRLERGGIAPPPPIEGPARGWENAARGWAAGAVLLAVLLLLVRALERCLHRRLFKGRRRSSEEWPTPNVMATSCQYGGPTLPRLEDSDTYPSENRETSSNDLPPPYSECANNEEVSNPDANKPLGMEEPPPPYSACYFTNPKNGIPTVHFYSRRSNLNNVEAGHSSTDYNAASSLSIVENEEADKISNCIISYDDNRDLRCEESNDARVINCNIYEVTGEANHDVVTSDRGNEHVVEIKDQETQERALQV